MKRKYINEIHLKKTINLNIYNKFEDNKKKDKKLNFFVSNLFAIL